MFFSPLSWLSLDCFDEIRVVADGLDDGDGLACWDRFVRNGVDFTCTCVQFDSGLSAWCAVGRNGQIDGAAFADVVFRRDVTGLLHFEQQRNQDGDDDHHDDAAEKRDGETAPTEMLEAEAAPSVEGDESHDALQREEVNVEDI